MDILRFITAGSVDDGKSTLIGRLLYDSKNILSDQLEAIEKSTKNKLNGALDLALLTDGLRAEREQGITIDVAYKYFETPHRKFIIADAPGHIQYTRNMITGASNSELIIILIDARLGVIEQTRRHSIIASLLGLPQVIVAINKMDLVEYAETVYSQIKSDYSALAESLGLPEVSFIPICALAGDNVVEPSANMPWYKGNPLLQTLESIEVDKNTNLDTSRFHVQLVIRPQTAELHDYRGYAGKIISGIYRKGDQVTVLPSGLQSIISKIEIAGIEVVEAFAHQSVTILLEDDIDISRGDMIVTGNTMPQISNEQEALLCWMDSKKLQVGNKYLLQSNSKLVRSVVKSIDYKLDVNTLEKLTGVESVSLNEVVKVSLKTASPIAFDKYANLHSTGCAILIDETSNATVAAVLFQ